jgi:type IV secretion system protein VirB4
MAIGFDYTGVVSSQDVRTPIMMYLLNVMDELVNGEPLIYHVAECWKALGDPAFAPFVKHKQKTIRKTNGLGIFDTQEVADLLSNENGRTMIEQSVTKLVLPNADADRDEYVNGLGLTQAEFDMVKALGATGSRRFLCKQGNQSVQCEFDLGGMDDFLAVLSSTTDNVELLDEVRAQVGDDPKTWLPSFYKRVRNRRMH